MAEGLLHFHVEKRSRPGQGRDQGQHQAQAEQQRRQPPGFAGGGTGTPQQAAGAVSPFHAAAPPSPGGTYPTVTVRGITEFTADFSLVSTS